MLDMLLNNPSGLTLSSLKIDMVSLLNHISKDLLLYHTKQTHLAFADKELHQKALRCHADIKLNLRFLMSLQFQSYFFKT